MEIELIQRPQSNMGSGLYKVTGVKSPCTFRDFIEIALDYSNREWGNFYLRDGDNTLLSAGYRNGKLESEVSKGLLDKLIDVNNIRSGSSWSRTDYSVSITEGQKYTKNSR